MRRVGAVPGDPDVPAVPKRRAAAPIWRRSADRDARLVVQRKDRPHRKLVEEPFLDHHPASAFIFLGRLKDEVDGAVAALFGGECLGRAEQHRRVAVVTAGVHLAFRVSSEEGTPDPLLQIVQCVHVGAKADRGRRIAVPDRADDPRSGEPAMHLAAEFGRAFSRRGRRSFPRQRPIRDGHGCRGGSPLARPGSPAPRQ